MNADGLRARAIALNATRRWFASNGYLEVPTPSLVASPAMEEHLYAVKADGGHLRTSPEFALKRVVASGLPRVYELGPCWREDEHGPWHRREFWMLEWYRAGAGLTDLMDEVESLVATVAEALGRPAPTSWRRATVRELFIEATGIDPFTASTETLSSRDADWDGAFFRRWLEEVEPTFTGALFVRDWPASQAALSTVRTDGAVAYAERFEAFINGVELANAFHELIDSGEQRRRFEASNAARLQNGASPHPIDEDLISAVGHMPKTSGIALGFDRLVAALCGWDNIGTGRVDG